MRYHNENISGLDRTEQARTFPMKIIFLAVFVAIVIGVAAGAILNHEQRPAYEAFSTSSTRVGDPGENLVGQNWSGNPKPGNG
jgi:hypothetical protein